MTGQNRGHHYKPKDTNLTSIFDNYFDPVRFSHLPRSMFKCEYLNSIQFVPIVHDIRWCILFITLFILKTRIIIFFCPNYTPYFYWKIKKYSSKCQLFHTKLLDSVSAHVSTVPLKGGVVHKTELLYNFDMNKLIINISLTYLHRTNLRHVDFVWQRKKFLMTIHGRVNTQVIVSAWRGSRCYDSAECLSLATRWLLIDSVTEWTERRWVL